MEAALAVATGALAPKIPAKYSRMPYRIIAAIALAQDKRAFPMITRSTRSVLARLVACIDNKDPGRAIFIRRTNLADDTDYSEPTMYRALDALEQHGLIERLPQERNPRTGRMSLRLIRMSQKALQLLGLTDPTASQNAHAANIKNIQGPRSQLKEQSAPAPTDATAKSIKVGGFKLPAELIFLTEKALTPTAVLSLMKLAKTHGKRLSDVVEAKAQAIAPFTGGSLYAYLRTLCLQQLDYAWLAQKQKSESVAKALVKTREAELDRLLARVRGKRFADNMGTLFEFSKGDLVFITISVNGSVKGSCPAHMRADILGLVAKGLIQPV